MGKVAINLPTLRTSEIVARERLVQPNAGTAQALTRTADMMERGELTASSASARTGDLRRKLSRAQQLLRKLTC
jgi:hypothetical protein